MKTKIEESKTQVGRNMHGEWEARTYRTENGQTYDITTMKRYSGGLMTVAYACKASQGDGFTVTQFSNMMDQPFLRVDHGKLRVTESVVRAKHMEALVKFDDKVSNPMTAPKVKYKPQIGDILFLGGYGKDKGYSGNHWIIYKIDGIHQDDYLCIEKDTLLLQRQNYVSDYKERRGQTIGMYFEEGFNMKSFGITEDALANMLIDAQGVKKRMDEEKRIADEIASKKAKEHEDYLSQFERPDRRKSTQIMKDYIKRTWKDVQKVEVKTDVFSGGNSIDVDYFAPEEIKDLENWVKGFQYGYFNGMEDIYEYHSDKPEIIVDNHILIQYKYAHARFNEVELLPEPSEPIKVGDIEIIDYSEKAIAVIGNTKPIKDQLKALGGRFNFRLSCGAGWIFPKTKKQDVESLIS